MGFSESAARRALRHVNSLERAIDWLFVHSSEVVAAPGSPEAASEPAGLSMDADEEKTPSVELVVVSQTVGSAAAAILEAAERKEEEKAQLHEDMLDNEASRRAPSRDHESSGGAGLRVNQSKALSSSMTLQSSPASSQAARQDSNTVTIHSSSSSISSHDDVVADEREQAGIVSEDIHNLSWKLVSPSVFARIW